MIDRGAPSQLDVTYGDDELFEGRERCWAEIDVMLSPHIHHANKTQVGSEGDD